MLFILRQLRRLELRQRSGQYFVYAFGEIVLIVVGILIAVQISEWTQEAAGRKLEQEYILRLKEELQENKLVLTNRKRWESRGIENVELLVKLVGGETLEAEAETLAYAIEQTGWTIPVPVIDNVWKELNSSGNASLLQNDQFRDSFTTFHTFLQSMVGLQKTFDQFYLGYRRLVGEVLEPELRVQIASKHGSGIYEGELAEVPTQAYMLDELSKLRGLKGFLADIHIARSANVTMMNEAHQKAEQLIALCEQELAK